MRATFVTSLVLKIFCGLCETAYEGCFFQHYFSGGSINIFMEKYDPALHLHILRVGLFYDF